MCEIPEPCSVIAGQVSLGFILLPLALSSVLAFHRYLQRSYHPTVFAASVYCTVYMLYVY